MKLPFLKRTIESVLHECGDLDREIAGLCAERDAAEGALAAREDVVSLLCDRLVARGSEQYQKRLKAMLPTVQRRALIDGPAPALDPWISLFPVLKPGVALAGPAEVEMALCFLFPDVVRSRLRDWLMEQPQDPKEGLPLAERRKQCQQLTERIVKLQSRRRELAAEIDQMRTALGGM